MQPSEVETRESEQVVLAALIIERLDKMCATLQSIETLLTPRIPEGPVEEPESPYFGG